MSRIIREARPTDMAEIMKVMDAAKGIMRQSGNMHQWSDGYLKHGFTYSGIIYLLTGDKRMAYQRIV